MSHRKQDRNALKAAMKKLRESRKPLIRAASAKMKRQKKAIRAIRAQLEKGPRTVPAIAEATGAATAETLWYVSALKKYGEIKEGEKEGGFFTYELAQTAEPADASD